MKTSIRFVLFLIAAVLLAGCGNGEANLPTPDIDALVTRAVIQTSEARELELEVPSQAAVSTSAAESTQTADEMPASAEMLITRPELPIPEEESEAEITGEAGTPQETAVTVITTAFYTDVPTNIPVLPTATIPPEGLYDRAAWQGQSPEDGVHVEANSEFDIEWFLLNTGTTTWTQEYTCRYFTGTDFTKPGKSRFPLTGIVPPNAIGSCIVDAIAPSEPGGYKMSVVLGNENDENFTIVDLSIWVE